MPARGSIIATIAITCTFHPAAAQWELQRSGTTADLRGVYAVGANIAWVSGTNGAVLRTVDAGKTWQYCAVPKGAEKLDFRAIQASDGETAVVMSSGTGDLSRLYKTTDGGKNWRLLFTNPDKDGFWDALLMNAADKSGIVLGDPVNGRFRIYVTRDSGETWETAAQLPVAIEGESVFAASNSSMAIVNGRLLFATGGTVSRLLGASGPLSSLPFPRNPSGGAFSVAYEIAKAPMMIAVGGDYKNPNDAAQAAAFSSDGGKTWQTPVTAPRGYRSAAAWDAQREVWISVGPNGTDLSRNNGLDWTPLSPSLADEADADKQWNALSLPFAVGPHGRIGKLRGSLR